MRHDENFLKTLQETADDVENCSNLVPGNLTFSTYINLSSKSLFTYFVWNYLTNNET
jgi:hypothetical protein